MATNVSIFVACQPERVSEAEDAIESAFTWLREVDTRLSRFDAGSELCRLNASAGRWRRVSAMLFEMVRESVRAAEASGGLFDPTILPRLEQLGYDRDFNLLAAAAERDVTPRASSEPDSGWRGGQWRRIELDPQARRVRLPEGARVDVGGIAKGWAADVGMARFFAAFPNVLVVVGGDLRVRGCGPDGYPWAVGVEDPRASESEGQSHVAVTALSRGGVAASGATSTWWRQGGQRQHHLLDPRTGEPARLWISPEDDGPGAGTLIATASAFAPTAAHAEIAAKVALLRGYPNALRAVEETWALTDPTAAAVPYTDEGVALILVMGDGRVVCSNNLQEWLATAGGGGEVWLD